VRSLQNLDQLAATGRPLIGRTPAIDGGDDTLKQIGGIAPHIAAFEGLFYDELLSSHALGDASIRRWHPGQLRLCQGM